MLKSPMYYNIIIYEGFSSLTYPWGGGRGRGNPKFNIDIDIQI